MKKEYADVTELADVQASDTCGYYFLVGSSPIVRTISSIHKGFDLWILDFLCLNRV